MMNDALWAAFVPFSFSLTRIVFGHIFSAISQKVTADGFIRGQPLTWEKASSLDFFFSIQDTQDLYIHYAWKTSFGSAVLSTISSLFLSLVYTCKCSSSSSVYIRLRHLTFAPFHITRCLCVRLLALRVINGKLPPLFLSLSLSPTILCSVVCTLFGFCICIKVRCACVISSNCRSDCAVSATYRAVLLSVAAYQTLIPLFLPSSLAFFSLSLSLFFVVIIECCFSSAPQSFPNSKSTWLITWKCQVCIYMCRQSERERGGVGVTTVRSIAAALRASICTFVCRQFHRCRYRGNRSLIKKNKRETNKRVGEREVTPKSLDRQTNKNKVKSRPLKCQGATSSPLRVNPSVHDAALVFDVMAKSCRRQCLVELCIPYLKYVAHF